MRHVSVGSELCKPETPARPEPGIRIEIETLQIEGFSRAHGLRMANALEAELSRLLSQDWQAQESWEDRGELRRPARSAPGNAPEIEIRASARPEEIARRAAAAIHASLVGKSLVGKSRVGKSIAGKSMGRQAVADSARSSSPVPGTAPAGLPAKEAPVHG